VTSLTDLTSNKFFAIRVTGGQEENVAKIIRQRVEAENLPIYSILIPPGTKGLLIIEADNANVVSDAVSGIKYFKRMVFGTVSPEEVIAVVKAKIEEEEFKVGDIVEVISGPFRDMKARVMRVDKDKKEVVIEFLDRSVTLPITVSTDMLKRSKG
jgi:transcriptional antiterminator NusG